jgi:MtrB/PioB family decaheme-associated outer membrane protein
MKRLSGGAPLLAVLLGVGVAPAASGETDVPGGSVTGELGVGGRVISGDWSSAKFNEYRSIRPGAWVEGFLRFEDAERKHHLDAWIDFTDEEDQTYRLEGGRWGHWGVQADFQRYFHRFADHPRTPFSAGRGDGDVFLELPPGWVQTDPLQDNLDAGLLRKRDVEFVIYNGGAEAFWKPNERLRFDLDYDVLHRSGNRPWSSGSFPGYWNFALPVKETIHDATAGAELAFGGWNFALDYNASVFDNRLKSITSQNPTAAGVADLTLAAAPDNVAHQVTVSTARSLELSIPVHVAGSFAYGRRNQDDGLLPGMPGATRHGLDGAVNTWLANLRATARPFERTKVDFRYRYYSYANQTDRLEASGERTVSRDWSRQRADLDATWRAAPGLKLKGGAGWNYWRRDNGRDRRNLSEWTARTQLDWRASTRAWAQLSYDFGYRNGSNYDGSPDEFTELRRYDQANRLSHDVGLLVQLDLREDVAFTLNGGFRNHDYDDTEIGLLSDRGWFVGGDITWVPTTGIELHSYYTWEEDRFRQRQDSGGRYTSTVKDRYHDVGFDYGIGRTRASGFSSSPAVDWQDLKSRRQEWSASIDYRINERFSVNAEYRYEKGDLKNFFTDPLGLRCCGGSPSNDLYLNQSVDDYHASVVEWGVTYHF